MKKHLLTLTFGICSTVLAFTACKKDKDVKPDDAQSIICLPDTIAFQDNGKYVLEYNTQKQLIKVNKSDKDGKYDGYMAFTYSANKITEVSYDANGTKLFEGEHYLNDNGSVNYSSQMWNYNNLSYDTVFYTYNSDNQIVLQVRKARYEDASTSVDSTSYVYSEGNLVSSLVILPSEKHEVTYTTSQYENKYNIFDDRVFIPGFYGKGSKNLVTKEVETIPGYGVMTTTYEYNLNSDGFIVGRNYLVMDSNRPDQPYYEQKSKISYACK
ncbi:hypothetical protein CHU_1902 [Sporocytophaga myxococcoides]|uniref:DUF4595 domain-containing protein n=1 Tax=Sporocytophaga myxococcoides TaxID=153721 RepID=A0A098LIR0_9BACT|nr:DUF4595 domain-containing protein [Sporocytophaga myxococcoides]GAL86830.1 hypothetical protein CHU_1902 [Sporocytophaga myxococcoides]